jgi:hypothetical protein
MDREKPYFLGKSLPHGKQAYNGERLPLVDDFMSFNEIIGTLNRQGHQFSFKRGSVRDVFPGAAETADTFSYFEAHTYLGSNSYDEIALANKIAGRQPCKFATWARANFPIQSGVAASSPSKLRGPARIVSKTELGSG